jgi:hypothetical protein
MCGQNLIKQNVSNPPNARQVHGILPTQTDKARSLVAPALTGSCSTHLISFSYEKLGGGINLSKLRAL